MRIVTLEELLSLVDEYSQHDVHRLFDQSQELVVYEVDGKFRAAINMCVEENDVRFGNTLLHYCSEDEVLGDFITFAMERYIGKRLHISVCSEEPLCYEVLRYYDFTVDEVSCATVDDEDKVEYITCSKQL